MNTEMVVEQTRRWIREMVIGLNLCPFARRVFEGELIRYAVTEAGTAKSLRDVLSKELQSLAATPADQVETAFLIHPNALPDFLDYNDFILESELLVAKLGLEGVIQIVGFHPRFQFSGTQPVDVENYTNRSPYPMLHLLREDSISRVSDSPEKMADIPARNIETMRRLGLARVKDMARG